MITFLSIEVLKARGLVGENVDAKVLIPTIEEVQDQYIHPILGTALYEDLKARVDAGTVASGNPVYTTLIEEYILPCMIRYVEGELQVNNSYKQSNKGTQVKTSDHNNPANVSDLIDIANKRFDKAEWYAQRLTDYLVANQTTYTKYVTQTRDDAIYPNKTSYDTGIYLGDDCDDCPPPREEQWREI
jgi:hypothetical protein